MQINRLLLFPSLIFAATVVAGCGLKGPLTLPPQSDEIVIRQPGQPAEGEAPATEKAAPRDERLPPPPLPGGNSGTARGG